MKKGTEKPIEIFVALFVILAVALVLLELFQSQITEKQKQLSDFEQEQKAKELQQSIALHCQQKCTEASNNGCSLQSLAALCLSGSHQVLSNGEFLDFNGNNQPDFNFENFGGEGVCENQVYCFSTIDSCCAQQIDISRCSEILDTFWDARGWGDNSDQRDALCSSIVAGSACDVPAGQEGLAWWTNDDFDELCS